MIFSYIEDDTLRSNLQKKNKRHYKNSFYNGRTDKR